MKILPYKLATTNDKLKGLSAGFIVLRMETNESNVDYSIDAGSVPTAAPEQ